jgi:hypothetical protein
MRKTANIKPISLFVFLAFWCPFLCPAQELEEAPPVQKARVTADRADIYLEPSFYSSVIETIGRGTELTLFETGRSLKKWLYVSYYSEHRLAQVTGFIDINLVEIYPKTPEPSEEKEGDKGKSAEENTEETAKKEGAGPESKQDKISIKVRKANIRLMPSLKSPVIHQLSFGAELSPLAKSGLWYRINLPPNAEGIILSGYIHSSIVKEIDEK